MNFADQHYVRVYTYDTPGWMMMKWQAKATLPLLMRKLDRAGVLDLAEFAGEEMSAVVARMIDVPVEIVDVGLGDLLKRATLVCRGQYLVMPNFIEAQEAAQSDRLRKAEQRARYRDRAMAIERGLVTPRDAGMPSSDPPNDGGAVAARDIGSRDLPPNGVNGSHVGTEVPANPGHGHSVLCSAVLAEQSSAVLGTAAAAGPRRLILAELNRHSSLRAIATEPVADMLATRFGTNEIAKGTKLEWVMQSIRDCAADSAGVGLRAEAIIKKLRTYCDNSRAPKKPNGANGHSRYAPTDAVIESKKPTRAAQAELQKTQRERAEALEAERKKREALATKKKPDPTEPAKP